MSVAEQLDLQSYCRTLAGQAQDAARRLVTAGTQRKDRWLGIAAERLRAATEVLLEANARDVDAADEYGLTAAQVDRLRLSNDRIAAVAGALEHIAHLPDPVGEVMEGYTRPNGLEIRKVRVPLGVVFFVYESRPNVTADAAALCVKSGNAVILRGGKEALHTNQAIYRVLADALNAAELPESAVQLVESTDREAVGHFLRMAGSIDLAIPRGGKGLIARVAEEARIPVLKHYEGNCHVYVDSAVDLAMAEQIILNAKCQRPGVCNAAESLLIHADVAAPFIARSFPRLIEAGVELRVCPATRALADRAGIAHTLKSVTDEDYYTEFLDLILAVRTVDSLDAAIAHINHYGSKHTEAIVTSDLEAARRFTAEVDSSAVFVNASTRFNDGGELGLGAEIGISTDKFHARGPCGLRELTSYKWVIHGTGQTR